MEVNDQIVVVTGASSGIGAATAEALSHVNPRAVVLLARNRSALDATAARLRDRGVTAHVFAVDLSDVDATVGVAASILAEVGPPDILINNAGAGLWQFAEETPLPEAVRMMAVPYFAAYGLTHAFLPGMVARGRGRIVNVSSPACFFAWPGATAYSVARWAMRGFSEALEADLHGTGVGVSLVVPGKVASPYFVNNPGSEERIPGVSRLYRTLSPEGVAALIIKAVKRNRRLIVRPRLMQLTVWWHRFFPGTVRALLRSTGARREDRT